MTEHMDKNGQFKIDWTLGRSDFRDTIQQMIAEAVTAIRVIPLPIEIAPGKRYVQMVSLVLSQVDCKRAECPAICCRTNIGNAPIPFRQAEVATITKNFKSILMPKFRVTTKHGETFYTVDPPCPFISSANKCLIYPERPFVCVLYPMQFGASSGDGEQLLCIASECPEARRIALGVYMTQWRLAKQVGKMKPGGKQ